MAARDLGPWQYTDDNGRIFVRRADKYITAQAATVGVPNVGGASALVGVYEAFPAGYRPRHVEMSSATGARRAVVVYSTDAPLWGATPPTMTARDSDGTTHTLSVDRKVGERLGRVIHRDQ
jgi:hypothetical protein